MLFVGVFGLSYIISFLTGFYRNSDDKILMRQKNLILIMLAIYCTYQILDILNILILPNK